MYDATTIRRDESRETAPETAASAGGAVDPGALAVRPLKILLCTDAWMPQVNGVVTTLSRMQRELVESGDAFEVIHPGLFRTVPCPRYPEIRLSILPGNGVRERIEAFDPDCIHVATEGPIGLAARRWCTRSGVPFTTSYHTQFALYLKKYAAIPPKATQRGMRWFHGAAVRTMVPTPTIGRELESFGFTNIAQWTRGVDVEAFHPNRPGEPTLRAELGLEGPVFLSVGRVAVEKNLEAFLRLGLPGSKLVVGDGPARSTLEKKHPDVHFVGVKRGEELRRHFAAADVFVFPSLTDTFGVVMLEANACGLPVAAHPVTGPIDVVRDGETGVLDEDLRTACLAALELDRAACRAHAERCSWRRCAEIFRGHLAPRTVPREHGRA